jgi:hypothetical protein
MRVPLIHTPIEQKRIDETSKKIATHLTNFYDLDLTANIKNSKLQAPVPPPM